MIDLSPWNKLQEFDLETAAKLWYASVNNVVIYEAPCAEDNPYYHRLIVGIQNHQLKIEDAHLLIAERGSVTLTRSNLIQFFRTVNEEIPIFLRSQNYQQEYQSLAVENSLLKKWISEGLAEGILNNNYTVKYWLARVLAFFWSAFREA